MGRTNPTFRNVLTAVRSRWGDYRRALRGRDQPHFDRLFEHADAHADAAGYLNADDPMDPILVSMLLEQEKRLAALDARLEALEASTNGGPPEVSVNREPSEASASHEPPDASERRDREGGAGSSGPGAR